LPWRQHLHLLNGWGRRKRAVAIHSLTSGLLLPFLVVYLVQAGYLSLVSAGAALLWGLATAKLGPVGVRAIRQVARPRLPAVGDHHDICDVHEQPDRSTGPKSATWTASVASCGTASTPSPRPSSD